MNHEVSYYVQSCAHFSLLSFKNFPKLFIFKYLYCVLPSMYEIRSHNHTKQEAFLYILMFSVWKTKGKIILLNWITRSM